jgi:hypothetical protein
MHIDERPSFFARICERAKRLRKSACEAYDSNLRLIQAAGLVGTFLALLQFVVEWDVLHWPFAAWRWMWA